MFTDTQFGIFLTNRFVAYEWSVLYEVGPKMIGIEDTDLEKWSLEYISDIREMIDFTCFDHGITKEEFYEENDLLTDNDVVLWFLHKVADEIIESEDHRDEIHYKRSGSYYL